MGDPAFRPRRSTRRPAAALTPAAPFLAMLAAVAMLFGCSNEGTDDPAGGTSPTTAATTATDPCSLLKVEQIRAATGWDVTVGGRPDAGPGIDPEVCNWQDVRAGGVVQVQLDADAGELGFERDRAVVVAEGVAVAGGGSAVLDDLVIDGAIAAFEVADLGQLTMLVGRDLVKLTVLGPDLDGNERRQLATDVAAATAPP